jgi:hypothetical protein
MAAGALLSTGCAATAVGAAVGGYIFGVGKIDERVWIDAPTLFQRAVEFAQQQGKVESIDPNGMKIKFRYFSSTVRIEVKPQPDPRQSRIELSARNEVMMLEKEAAETIFRYLVPDEVFIVAKPKRESKAEPEPLSKPAQQGTHEQEP